MAYLKIWFGVMICIIFHHDVVRAQITYFDQDYSNAASVSNTSLGFDSYIQTMTSSYNLGNGSLELLREKNGDASQTSGLVRAVRTTSFSPNPETLYIQMTFYARDLFNDIAAPNGLYFYIGEGFNAGNNSIPSNSLMFARISLSFTLNYFVVHDLAKNVSSVPISNLQPVTITWVLNNSNASVPYKFPENVSIANHLVGPQKYDVWVNNDLLVDEVAAYPAPNTGVNAFSFNKLSNFEIRYNNGFGAIVFQDIKIRNIDGILPVYFQQFSAVLFNQQVNLNWTMETRQEPILNYTIQRSKNGSDFEVINQLKVLGGNDFSWTDISPMQGLNYYRIFATNSKGLVLAQSKLKVVENQASSNGSNYVYPNPASRAVLNLNSAHSQHIVLYTSNGTLIPTTTVPDVQTQITQIYPKQLLQPGIYVLQFYQEQVLQRLSVLVE